MITRLFKQRSKIIYPRAEHNISRKNIDGDALRVLYRLADAGYVGYLVGGSVRDLLLGRTPKDFDVGTDAQPRDVRKLFRNCYLVGKRFRLAHVVFGRKVIETSTFRRQPRESDGADDNLYQKTDNTFGTPEEDALRRDFTVNGLFYDIKTFAVIDYVGGVKDLKARVMRSIGDPNIRFREDPVRMMRAIRFAARLDFTIERQSCRAIKKYHSEITKASVPRLLEELLRLFTYRSSAKAFKKMYEYGLLADIVPELAIAIDDNGGGASQLWNLLARLDADPSSDSATSGLRLGVLCYPLFCRLLQGEEATAQGRRVNRLNVARKALEPFVRRLRIPKVCFYTCTNLLDVLPRFEQLLQPSTRRKRFTENALFPEALALWRITHPHSDKKLLASWEAELVNRVVDEDASFLGDEADEDAWRRVSGAPVREPRAGFHGKRNRPSRFDRRRRPQVQEGHEDDSQADGTAQSGLSLEATKLEPHRESAFENYQDDELELPF